MAEKLNLEQPFYASLREADTFFTSKGHPSPFTGEGYRMMVGNKSTKDKYKGFLTHHIDDEGWKETIESILDRQFSEESNPFFETLMHQKLGESTSAEGWGAGAVTGGFSSFMYLNPALIVGYTARSMALNWYQILNRDIPEFNYRYRLDSVYKGSDYDNRLPMNQSIREGKLAGFMDLPLVTPKFNGFTNGHPDASKANPHIYNYEDSGNATNPLNGSYIAMGKEGNLITESGDGLTIEDTALEDDIIIDSILFTNGVGDAVPSLGTATSSTANINTTANVKAANFRRIKAEGDSSIVYFNVSGLKLYDGSDVTESFNVQIDLDNGKYFSTARMGTNIIGFRFKARRTNIANDQATISTAVRHYFHSFKVRNQVRLATSVIPEQESFNVGGDGVSFVSDTVEQLSMAYAGIKDSTLENEIYDSIDKPLTDFPLYPKLLGYKDANATFDMAARRSGGDDPHTWAKEGLKRTIIRLCVKTETNINITGEVPREWVLMGYSLDIECIPDITYVSTNSETSTNMAGGALGNKWGFALTHDVGFSDNYRRRVKVFGSEDPRWSTRKIAGVMKTTSLDQPTTIYWPYSFRVFNGIRPEMRNQPAICIFSQDYSDMLSSIQWRLQLQNNVDDLNKAMLNSGA